MSTHRLSAEEIARRGEEIYHRDLLASVEAMNKGKFLVIDIETGDYEIDDDDLTATRRLLARHPTAETYGVRIGYPTAYRIGAHSLLERP
jgi:hypothetical protein